MTDTWIPRRAANRQQSLEEAIDIIQNQRDLMVKYLTNNKLLTPIQMVSISAECRALQSWLLDHQIPKEDATGQTPE